MAIITNISELTTVKTYKCFSQRLSHCIQTELGVLPVNVYKHSNGKLVNVYILTPELSQFLTDWTQNKRRKGESDACIHRTSGDPAR